MFEFIHRFFRLGPSADEADLRISLATLTARNEDLLRQLEATRDELLAERQAHMDEIKTLTNWYVGQPVFPSAGAPPVYTSDNEPPVTHSTRRAQMQRARLEFDQGLKGKELDLGRSHPISQVVAARHRADLVNRNEAPDVSAVGEEIN